jgi:hypothetical protein
MTLTRQFDFSTLPAPLTLSYWTWYDLEADYDYLYLLASRDGENWQILTTPSGVSEDPTGNSYGWAYNGTSGGKRLASWVQETVDISQFAGEKVYLRFEYITDAAVNGEGFLLDDITVPQAGYSADFEDDAGGWQSNGWVRVQNLLQQTYQLALITLGETTSVKYIPLGSDLTYEIPISIGDGVNEVVLVVSGTTRLIASEQHYASPLFLEQDLYHSIGVCAALAGQTTAFSIQPDEHSADLISSWSWRVRFASQAQLFARIRANRIAMKLNYPPINAPVRKLNIFCMLSS